MNDTILQSGAEIAHTLRTCSDQSKSTDGSLQTVGDLLAILKENPPRSFGMLRTACGLLGAFLDQPSDQILLDIVDQKRSGFRSFLKSRKYAENSIRTYIYQICVLMKAARQFGWHPEATVSEEWKALLVLAKGKGITDIISHFARATKTPAEVTIEEVDRWAERRAKDGLLFSSAAVKRNCFWRLLRITGSTALNPQCLIKREKYGIPLDQLSPELKREVEGVLKWKQADFARYRPKRGKIRAVSANSLRQTVCQLAGFVTNVCGMQPVSLCDLFQKELVEGFVEWAINERGTKGHSLQSKLSMLAAVLKQHPDYASKDLSWFKPLSDSIPLEDDSDRKRRKSMKYLEYEVLETIPGKIRVVREAYGKKKSSKHLALLAMEELMMQWFLVLPWRQQNLRECRIGGPAPNLFKRKVPAFSQLDKPGWVIEEETRNSGAEFWQFQFSASETKTGITVHALLPRQLVEKLEQYLVEHRPHLLNGRTTPNLFLNSAGKPMCESFVWTVIGKWSLKFGGVRTTPHLFRDAVAFKWLKEHPKDYLTLSKMLWHQNVQTTLGIYGSRFNESSGVCAMEAWLDEREAKRDSDSATLFTPTPIR